MKLHALKERIEKYNYNKLAFLYIIKFILAFAILLQHWRFSSIEMFGNLHELVGLGANQCYMLISGMLFYLAYYEKLANEEVSPLKFLIKRLLRIYILYIVIIMCNIMFDVIINLQVKEFKLNFWDIFRTLFFFGDSFFVNGSESPINYPAWFLCPLFLSYILACIIIVLTKKKKSIWWFAIPVIYGFWAYFTNEKLIALPLIFSPRNSLFVAYFFVGFYLMLFLKDRKINLWIRILCFVVCFINLFIHFYFHDNDKIFIYISEGIANFAIWIPMIIAFYGTKINILFDNKVCKHISNYSIHLWLWHIPFLSFLTMFGYSISQENRYFMLLYLILWCLISYLIQIFWKPIYTSIKKKLGRKKDKEV